MYKYRDGLIFDDRFQTIKQQWLLTPRTSFRLHTDLLRMNHAGETMALLSLPKTELTTVLEVEASYMPVKEDDTGGLIIWKSPEDHLQFLESTDTVNRDYSRWKAVQTGTTWDFYAMCDGEWKFFDTGELDASKVGIVLHGEMGEPLDLTRVTLCRSEYVSVGNLESGAIVRLIKDSEVVASDVVANGSTGTMLKLPQSCFEGTLQVISDGEAYELTSIFYGGDVYLWVTTAIKILREGTELALTDFTNLGRMQHGSMEMKVQLFNASAELVTGVKVTVEQYEQEAGYTWIKFAKDAGGRPGEYGKQLDISTIRAGEVVDFWMRIDKDASYFSFNPVHFRLQILTD